MSDNSSNSSNNSGMENGAASAPAQKKAPVDKRKDMMTDIKTRLEAGYDMEKNGRRNEKQLAAKVKFFEDKIAKGTFKEFMRPRMVEATTLLERVRGLKATPLAAKATVPSVRPTPAAPAFKAPVAATLAGVKPPVKSQKKEQKRDKALDELLSVAKAQGVVAMAPPAPVARRLEPVAEENGEVNENSQRNSQIVNEYLVKATQKYLPLPQFYDPYTGRKFAPEESPMTPIEKAYKQLKKIHKKAYKRAATLRARAAAAAAPEEGSRRRNTRRQR